MLETDFLYNVKKEGLPMKLKCFALFLVVSLFLSACGGCASKPSNDFDFDNAMKNINLDGHKISLPLTLEDLGEGYSFIKGTDSEDKIFVVRWDEGDEGKVLTVIKKGDDTVCYAILPGDKDDDYNEKSEIIGLVAIPNYGDIQLYDFSLFDRSKEEILDFFGDGLQLSGYDESTSIYEYINSEDSKILLVFHDGMLTSVEIHNKKA